MDYKLLSKDIYEDKLSDLLKRREDSGNEGQYIYADPKGIPTVGIGYALLYANHTPRDIDNIKADMKIALPSEKYADIRWDKVEKLLGNIHKHLDSGHGKSIIKQDIDHYYKNEGSHALRLSTQEEKSLLVNATLPQFEAALDKKLDTSLPYSQERVAVVSQLYRLGTSGAPSMIKAINEGNRAEAWYEIRYNSNGDNLTGNYGRVIEESDLFGLHDKYPNAKNEKDIENMFHNHASKIKEEEKKSPLYESKAEQTKESSEIEYASNGMVILQGDSIVSMDDIELVNQEENSTLYANNDLPESVNNYLEQFKPQEGQQQDVQEL